MQSAASTPHDYTRQIGGIVAAGLHAGHVHQNGIVERGPLTFLNRVQPAGDVGELLQKKLVHLQPIGRHLAAIGVRQFVMSDLDVEVRELQIAVIVVQLQCADASRIGLERQHENIAHQPHVVGKILWNALGRPRHIGLVEVRPPALKFPMLAREFETQFDLAHRIEVLVEFLLIAGTDLTAEPARLAEHRVEHASITPLSLTLEEPVECEGRIQFQRRRSGRRTPRNVRAVKHRIVLVNPRIRPLAAEDKARHFRRVSVMLRDKLIETGPRTNLAAGC